MNAPTQPVRKVPVTRDISRGAKFGIAILLALVLLIGGGNLWATYALSQSTKQQIEQQQESQQAAQLAASAELTQKLCTSLDRLAALKPPAGDAQSNPSRAFEQQQHAILAGLGPDIKCH